MNQKQTINYWAEVDAGFRGSVMLRMGALATGCGGLVNLGARVLADASGPSQSVTIVAWLFFILGLWLLAGGFFWVGSHPFLSRFGFVVGALHAAQGVHLLILLFTFVNNQVSPASLTVGRLVATMLFVFFEREWLSVQTGRLLAGAAGLMLLKTVGRALGYLPELGNPLDPLLDTVLLLFLAAALIQLASAIRREEMDWAQTIYESSNADFADFNNPEHAWNRPDAEQDKKSR